MRSLRLLGFGFSAALGLASCRQVFGLEEPQAGGAGGGGAGGGGAGGGGAGGDPCLAANKPVEVLQNVAAPGRTLGCDKDWQLDDDVYVYEGATLTIEPGTRLRAAPEKRLVVEPGAQIHAEGTADRPIVFSGLSSSHWGGLELRGRAPGSAVAPCKSGSFMFDVPGAVNDSSGTLRYVRIERGGSQETDCTGALILLGVGRGTVLDQLDIRESQSDGVSITGGAPQLSHVVVTDPEDDGMDIENAADVRIQFFLYRGLADAGCPNNDRCPDGLDIDADANVVEASNITLCAPQDPTDHDGLWVGDGDVRVRRAVIVGHATALDWRAGLVVLENGLFSNEKDLGPGDADGFDEEIFKQATYGNTITPNPPIACFGAVDFVPPAPLGKPGVHPTDDFFVDAPWIGALTDGDDWMSWITIPP